MILTSRLQRSPLRAGASHDKNPRPLVTRLHRQHHHHPPILPLHMVPNLIPPVAGG